MIIVHNSHDIRYRNPFGAVPVSNQVNLNIYAPEADAVSVRLWREGHEAEIVKMSEQHGVFAVSITVPSEPCILWYYFIVKSGTKTIYYGNSQGGFGGEGMIYTDDIRSFQISVYKETPVPDWYKNGIVYQIFPDRFARSASFDEKKANSLLETRGGVKREIETDWDVKPINEFDSKKEICRWKFYGGSLDGIREKLDYLESLGVTAIYLNPIFKARSTHRYDTADYMEIDPLLGDEKSFVKLAKEAKARGIRLILDGVFNHCGADSIYFDYYNQYYKEAAEKKAEGFADVNAPVKGAWHHKDSIYRSWFSFQKEKPGFRCWWGIADLPDFNTKSPEYIEFINGKDGVVKKWLQLGASGWRLDVADELPNEFLKEVRKAIKEEDPDNLLMGEVWEDASNKYNYGTQMEYFWGEELDCTMNYPFRAAVLPFVTGDITAQDFINRYMSIAENYPPENFYGNLNLLGSHDRERVLNILGGYPMAKYGFDSGTKYHDLTAEQFDLAKKRYKMLSILQYCLPGVPDIYYGDEAGVMGGTDPDCRRTYPWGKEDKDLVEHFQWLGKYYHAHPCLKDGQFKLYAINDDTLAVERYNKTEKIVLIINRSDKFTNVFYKGQDIELWPFDGKIL